MMRVSSLLCWSCFFASLIAAYILPRQTEVRNLYGTVNGAARGTARSLSRGSARGTADSPSRGLIRDTNSSLSNDSPSGLFNASAIGPAGGPTGGIHTAFENATSKMYLNSTADVLTCLFAVQDVVSVRYWAHYESEIFSMKINVASTITKVTKYIDTTITSVITTTVLTTTTGTRVYEEGRNLLTAYNEAPRPSWDNKSLNGSVITTLGFTITSPQPFFVYNAVTLIQMPAITLENGNSACVAASTILHSLSGRLCRSETISNLNPYVINYWSTTDTERSDTYVTATDVVTRTRLKVVLDPPFVYQPDWGTTSDYYYARPTLSTMEGFVGTISGWTDDHYVDRDRYLGHNGKGYSDYGYEDYGYIPQVLVDSLLENSGLSSALFQSISLLPGGPMIDTGPCWVKLPVHADVVHDLTDSSEETVNIAGCFHPGACLGVNEPAIAVTSSAAETVPQSASVPARINHSPPAIKTQAANIKTSLVASPGTARSSDTMVAMATPQVLPLQSSQTEQSNGGTPGQQLPPQPNHSPIATAQKFNGATPDQKSPSQPDVNPASQNLNGKFDEQPQPQSGSNSVSPAQNANDAQNFNEATSDQDFSSQPIENLVSSTQNSNDDTQDHIPPSRSISNSITSALNYHKTTLDQQPASPSDSNPISAAQNSNEDTRGPIFSSQSKSSFKTSEQDFNEAKFDQQLSFRPNSNPTSPTQILSGDLQSQIFSSRPTSNLIAYAHNVNKAKPDQQSSSQPNVIPTSPAQDSNGETQRQESLSQSKPGPNLVTILHVSSQLLRPKPTIFRESSPQAANPIIIAEMPEAPKPAVAPMITVGPLILTANSKQNFIIGSQILAPGSSPIVAFGITLSLLPSASALVVNGITSPLTAAAALPTLGNNFNQELHTPSGEQKQNQRATLTSAAMGDNRSLAANSVLFVIDRDQTLAADGTSVIAAGASFTLAPSKLATMIDGATIALHTPDAAPSPVPTLADNGRTIVTNAPEQPSFDVQALGFNSGLPSVSDIAGQDFTAIVNGTTIHSEPSSSGVISAASLVHIIPELVIDSQTAFAGGTPITASGLPISLSPFGNEVIVGNSTERISSGSTLSLTIGSQTIIATLKNGYVIGNQTLTPGAAATNVGIFTSLVPGGSGPAIQGSATNNFEAGYTSKSSSEKFTGDAAKDLPGLKTVAGILIVIFSLGFPF